MKSMQLPKMSTVKPKAVLSANTADSDFPNLLNQKSNPSAPNQAWVSDITYIRGSGRFYYPCILIDSFARKVLAYRDSANINVQLTINTL